MKNRTIEEILGDARRIAISGHIRPDGDCAGSGMALYHYLRDNRLAETVDIYLGELPKSFEFLEGIEEIRHQLPSSRKPYDLFFCLDCADKKRLEFSAPLFEEAKRRCCIDHHISQGVFTEEAYVDQEASSTAELVYQLLDPEKISKRAAEALYLGIIHDTGVFQYPCTAPSTHRMAAVLLEKGVDAANIIQKTYYEKTDKQNRILGKMLVESRLLLNGRMIVAGLSKEEMAAFDVKPSDLNGIVSQLRLTEGVEAAVFYYEFREGGYKVSLRSGDTVDVNLVASVFGGGGHQRAAGLESSRNLEEILRKLEKEVCRQIGEKAK